MTVRLQVTAPAGSQAPEIAATRRQPEPLEITVRGYMIEASSGTLQSRLSPPNPRALELPERFDRGGSGYLNSKPRLLSENKRPWQATRLSAKTDGKYLTCSPANVTLGSHDA